MEQRTSVWNEKDGVYAVREEDKESIKRQKYLDDGSIRITDTQAQDLADEATLETFGSMVNTKALTAEELGLSTASSSAAPASWTSARGTPTARTPSRAADNPSEDAEVDDEDDEEEAPLSRMLGNPAPPPRGEGKTKAKAKGKGVPMVAVKMESSPTADKTSN